MKTKKETKKSETEKHMYEIITCDQEKTARTKLAMRAESAVALIQEWRNKSEKEIATIQKTLKENSFQYCLEWNHLETGAALEGKLAFAETLLRFMAKNPPLEAIKSIKTTIGIITENLLGNDLSSEIGPWDSHSTSNGTNRLAIIRSNVMRLNRKRAIQVLSLLESD